MMTNHIGEEHSLQLQVNLPAQRQVAGRVVLSTMVGMFGKGVEDLGLVHDEL